MYLHTRLLLGIAVITLFALGATVLVPLWSIRADVSREIDASLQLTRVFFDLEHDIRAADSSAQARAAAARDIRRAASLRHVKIALVDPSGAEIAASPTDDRQGSWLAGILLPPSVERVLTYPLSYRGARLGALRVWSNPLSETTELEGRVERDLVLLGLVILAMAASICSMVRRSLKPVSQIQTALTALEAGTLGTRLPSFRLKDLAAISQRFNHCAAALEEAAVQRRELTRRLVDVEEDERRSLARELHDELGQILTAIKVDAAYIAREAAAGSPKIETCARGIEGLAGELMDLIRGMLARLRPHGLETAGLSETLEELVTGWQSRVADRMSCSLAFDGPVNSLSADLNITLYRLIQECLTNAVRHSRARTVLIRVTVERETADGPGRVTAQVLERDVASDGAPARAQGSGLLGMRERVEAQGGELRITALGTGGMSVEAWMPVYAMRDETSEELADA